MLLNWIYKGDTMGKLKVKDLAGAIPLTDEEAEELRRKVKESREKLDRDMKE